MNTTSSSGGANQMAPPLAPSMPDHFTQSFNEFTHSMYTQLSGMQKDIGRVLGSLDHLHGSVQRLERRIDSVETKLTTRIDVVEAKLTAQIEVVETKLTERIDSVETKLSERIDSVEMKLSERIDSVETKLTDRINLVETKMGERIDLAETVLGTRIDALDADVKVHKRLVLVASGGLGMVAVLVAGAQTVADMFIKLDALRAVP